MNKIESETSWNITTNSGDRREDGPFITLAVVTTMEMLERGWNQREGRPRRVGGRREVSWTPSWRTWQGGVLRRMGAQTRKGGECGIRGRVRNTTRGAETRTPGMLSPGVVRGGEGVGRAESGSSWCVLPRGMTWRFEGDPRIVFGTPPK